MSEEKNAVDVAEKAIDTLANGGEKIAQAIEQIGRAVAESSPHVWAKLVEWHRVGALGELVVFCFQLVACVSLSLVFWRLLTLAGDKKKASAALRQKASSDGEITYGARRELERMADNSSERADMFRMLGVFGLIAMGIVTGIVTSSFPERLANYSVPEKAAAVELILMSRGEK